MQNSLSNSKALILPASTLKGFRRQKIRSSPVSQGKQSLSVWKDLLVAHVSKHVKFKWEKYLEGKILKIGYNDLIL